MSERNNQQLVEEKIAAFNAHDVDRYVEGHDDAYVWENDAFPAPVRGPEGVKEVIEASFKAFPDLHLEIDQIIASGDYVVGRWRATGTHKGEFSGIAPTNRKINVRGCTVSEIKDGRFIKSATYSDQLALLQQLGVPAVKAAGAS
jgi:steroid delta-isomerase-like uncharacterized protein